MRKLRAYNYGTCVTGTPNAKIIKLPGVAHGCTTYERTVSGGVCPLDDRLYLHPVLLLPYTVQYVVWLSNVLVYGMTKSQP